MRLFIKLGLIALSMTGLTFASSTEDIVERQKEILSKLDSVKVKEGVEFGGEFRSEFFRSQIDGNGTNEELRKREDITYTQVDFNIKARPNTSTTANVIMRMHASWPNFFGSLNNPISTRWISLDGKIGDFVWYHVGDLKAKWSEYSIWSDNSEQIFEPYVFAEQRAQQMNEAFLGDNYRPVQGVDLKTAFKAGKVDYIGINLLGARLRTAFMPKENPTSTKPQNLIVNSFEGAEMDKFLVGGKFDIETYNVALGASYHATMESPLTSKYSVTAPMTTTNLAVTANIGIDRMAKLDGFTIEPKAEFAMSTYSLDTVGGKVIHENFIGDVDGNNSDMAMKAGAKLGFEAKKTFNVMLDVGYVNNGTNFRNDLSQSPEFIGQQIMNTDNLDKPEVNKNYTYFDARYHGAYKAVTKMETEQGMAYVPYPTSKCSYTNMTLTAEESGALRAQTSEQAYFQPFTPFAYGAATPNLTGLDLDFNIGALDNGIEVAGYFSTISEIEGFINEHSYTITETDTAGKETEVTKTDVYNWETASFTNFGIGANIHIGKLAGISRIIDLSVGYEMASATRAEGANGTDENNEDGEMNLTSGLLNAGLYVNLIPRLSLLGGFQMFSNADDTKVKNEDGKEVNLLDRTDMHWLAGLEYKLNDGAYLLVEGGMISSKDNLDDANSFEQAPIIMTKIKVNF